MYCHLNALLAYKYHHSPAIPATSHKSVVTKQTPSQLTPPLSLSLSQQSILIITGITGNVSSIVCSNEVMKGACVWWISLDEYPMKTSCVWHGYFFEQNNFTKYCCNRKMRTVHNMNAK